MPAPQKYPDELRERAIRDVFESGRPIAHVGADLSVHREALRQWVPGRGLRRWTHDRLTTSERERMKGLERETEIAHVTGIAKPLIYNTAGTGVQRGELDRVALPGGQHGFQYGPQAAASDPTRARSGAVGVR